MSGRKYEINMSQGSIFKNVIRFSIPLILTNLLQTFYNAADLIVIGRWAGSDEMAAVGATASLTNLMLHIFLGLSLGASVVVSKRYGARDHQGIKRAVHTSIAVSILAGIVATLLGEIFSTPLLKLMGTPEGTILDGASLYMRILYLGIPAMMVYNFGASIMRAVGDTKRPLYILAITGIVNVGLNLILVIGFNMGVAGVAIATIVSNYLSMIAVLYYLINSDGSYRLILKELRIYKEDLLEIAKIGLPAGVQGSVFSLSNVVIQSSINSFGNAVIAGCVASQNIENFIYTAMNAFYQATITCVSQNYGAGRKERINKAIYIPMICVVALGIILAGITVLVRNHLIGFYISNSPEALSQGVQRLMRVVPFYFLCGIMDVLTGALRGLGYSSITAVNSLLGACGFRIIWIFFIMPLNPVPSTLYWCWAASWAVVIIMHGISLLAIKNKAIGKIPVLESNK